MADKQGTTSLKQLEDILELYLVKKAPSLPTGAKEAIVKFGPWIVLIILIMTLPLVLAVLGLGSLFIPISYMGGVNSGVGYTASLVLMFITLILEAVALPGLFRREKRSWNLVYYATLIGAVQSAISFNLVGLIVGSLISLYILFQIKSYYTK